MKAFDKLLDFMRLGDDEDYYDDEDAGELLLSSFWLQKPRGGRRGQNPREEERCEREGRSEKFKQNNTYAQWKEGEFCEYGSLCNQTYLF